MCNCAHNVLRRLDYIAVLAAIGLRQRKEHALKTRTPILITWRKVRSAVVRPALRGQKCGERPSTLSADCIHGNLVTTVDIGSLVAVNLDGYEILVDDLRGLRVVIRLAVHDMAPVAPDRTDIKQYGFVLI